MMTLTKHFRLYNLSVFFVLATYSISSAQARTVYFEDFEQDHVGSEWSKTSIDITPIGQRAFLRQFPRQTDADETNVFGYSNNDNTPLPDAVYSLTFSFPHSASTLMLDFESSISGSDETWGLDNVKVEVVPPLQPELKFLYTEDYSTSAGEFTRYRFSVSNWSMFPDELFEAAPDLPACGLNTSASRTFVNIYSCDGTYIYGFCALDSADDLTKLWFGCKKGEMPPDQIYVVLHDRRLDVTYTSECRDLPDLSTGPYAGYSVLIDASRDGGAWWFPQSGAFDSRERHQGKALADYLGSVGFSVTELGRGETITPKLLSTFDIVIRANAYGVYDAQEVMAYQDYVYTGGKLLLLGDYVRPNEQDSLALSFGILFQGISRGENVLDNFFPHPITDGVSELLHYNVGCGAVELPPTAEMLGFLSEGTYLDMNDNQAQEDDEPIAPCALGRMRFGRGEIVFSGDTNLWETIPQPLVDNTINWLIEISQAVGDAAFGIETSLIDCVNITTDQAIQVPLDGLRTWDSKVAGLDIMSGDEIEIVIHGIAK